MRRSDGTNIAIGGILVGISAVILGLLSPIAAAIVAVGCGLLGLYMIIGGVYLGWWTPATSVEHVMRPNLQDADAHVFRVQGQYVFLQLAVYNGGRDDLIGPNLNVIVSPFISEMQRCSAEGAVGLDEHKGTFWRREGDERFWHGNVTFPGMTTRFIFFRLTMPTLQDFQATLKVFSPDLAVVPWVGDFHLSVAEFMSPEELSALARASETGVQE